MPNIKLAIIEDNHNIRTFIADYFTAAKDIDFVFALESIEDYFAGNYQDKQVDVLLLDINLPGMSGLEGIAKIKQYLPNLDILMFTIYDDADRIFKALCAGASGYLLKSTPIPKIKNAIVEVHRGGAPMSPSIAKRVVQYFQPNPKNKTALTAREEQIVNAMVDGLSYKMIADKLMISINTVSYHIKNIYKKLEVNSKAEVIALSLKKKL
ncbi:MAG: response regulator transcription factor [Bacteroidota bacterium]